jgi:hypothetical protein
MTKTQISTNNILSYVTGYGIWTGNEQGKTIHLSNGMGGAVYSSFSRFETFDFRHT